MTGADIRYALVQCFAEPAHSLQKVMPNYLSRFLLLLCCKGVASELALAGDQVNNSACNNGSPIVAYIWIASGMALHPIYWILLYKSFIYRFYNRCFERGQVAADMRQPQDQIVGEGGVAEANLNDAIGPALIGCSAILFVMGVTALYLDYDVVNGGCGPKFQ